MIPHKYMRLFYVSIFAYGVYAIYVFDQLCLISPLGFIPFALNNTRHFEVASYIVFSGTIPLTGGI